MAWAPWPAGTGVIDQYVHVTKSGGRLVESSDHSGQVGDVERDGDRLAASLVDLLGDAQGPVGMKVVDDQGGALRCQGPGDARAHVLSCARNQRDMTRQVEHGSHFLRVDEAR